MELIKSILAQLNIDKSFFYQFFLVVIAYFVLSIGIFKPLLKILTSRKEKTSGKLEKVKELDDKVLKLKEDFDNRWSEYENKAFSIRDELYEKANTKVKTILKKAHEDAENFLQTNRKIISKNYSETMVEMENMIPELSSEVQKVLVGQREG